MDNKKTCENIANDLDLIARGDMYIVHGELRPYDTLDEEERKLVEDTEILAATMSDYFEDDLGHDYVVDSDKEYKHVIVCVAYGGPNIYIDTSTGNVELYWWGSTAKAPMSEAAIRAVDELFEELYDCT